MSTGVPGTTTGSHFNSFTPVQVQYSVHHLPVFGTPRMSWREAEIRKYYWSTTVLLLITVHHSVPCTSMNTIHRAGVSVDGTSSSDSGVTHLQGAGWLTIIVWSTQIVAIAYLFPTSPATKHGMAGTVFSRQMTPPAPEHAQNSFAYVEIGIPSTYSKIHIHMRT